MLDNDKNYWYNVVERKVNGQDNRTYANRIHNPDNPFTPLSGAISCRDFSYDINNITYN